MAIDSSCVAPTDLDSVDSRYSLRLRNKIQEALEQALTEGELVTASELVQTLEVVLLRATAHSDHHDDAVCRLLAYQERLWSAKLRARQHLAVPDDPAKAA
jgi:hypothetical protein